MTPLAYERKRWALARIVTAPTFALGIGPWQVQPMWSRRRKGYGFELLNFNRCALPAIGEATFRYRFGLIDGDVVGVAPTDSVTRRLSGEPWDSSQDASTAPDLKGYEVRIQLAEAVARGVEPSWETQWWGVVEYQTDTMWPAAAYPAGVRTYRCVDGFARTKRWPLNRHTATGDGSIANAAVNVEGHPGYNVGLDGRIIGNLDSNSIGSLEAAQQNANPAIKELIAQGDTAYKLHTHQGAAAAETFTVQTACEDAMRKTRGVGDPIFSFSGDTDLLGDTIAMPVSENDSAWDFVARHCRRERGRGLVFVDWADDSASPTGDFSPRLTIRPQMIGDIHFSKPASVQSTGYALAEAVAALAADPLNPSLIAAVVLATAAAASAAAGETIPGATSKGTTTIVDLISDHRAIADETTFGDRYLHVADAVETSSELMQLLVTLSYFDGADVSLSQRWLSTRESAFSALAPTARQDEAWWPLWNLHGLPNAWTGTAKDHNGGSAYACDFACNDDGNLVTSQTAGRIITSPLLCKILPDLPLYEGYDYTTSTPKRKIGDQTNFDETGQPARKPPLPLIRRASNRYITSDQVGDGRTLSMQVRGRDLLVYSSADRASGFRVVGNTATKGLGSLYNLSSLGITVGLELPHRVRRRTLRAGITDPRRIVTIRLPDLHLWLAHSGAIWDIDATDRNADGYAPRRGAGGAASALPGILRDDRDALSRIHALACSWYLSPRQTARWTIRDCGLFDSFTTGADDSESVTYPRLGQVVTDFKAAGQITQLNTPITMVAYDHQTGRTTWETDWQELDTTA